ncbi:MAG: DUF6249 domain-containing protein [Nevskia sp.]|jgi:hypothetical protein|nr:DUF6249 domain-containing protein [Nevskia sp.]
MLSILDVEAIHIDGLDKLAGLGQAHSGITGELIGLVLGLTAIVLIFGTPIIIVLSVLRHRSRKQRLTNEIILKLAESGQPIPPQLFIEPITPNSDLRRGVILLGVGLGLIGFFFFGHDHDGIGIGFIPLMIGLGYLLSWKLEQGKKSA